MPELKLRHIFISHAWRYDEHYYGLERLLDQAQKEGRIKFTNYSVPRHDPALDPDSGAGRAALTRALDGQIRPASCVLVLAGMYAHYSYWIAKEIEIANSYAKPIVGVYPRGQELAPRLVQAAAHVMVRWNTDSILEAIRNHS